MCLVILKNFCYLITSFTIILMIVTSVTSWNFGYASSVSQNSDVTVLNPDTTPKNHTNNVVINSTSCHCVVFRMDDLQDNWIRSAQIAGINLFLSKNIPLTLAIIMNSIGNDSQIIDKIKSGINGPNVLFELGIHGWNHVDYTKLNEKQQQESLRLANEKMLRLFGNRSDIFITPYGPFNNDTIKAMRNLGIQMLSSALVNEQRFDYGGSIVVTNRPPGAAITHNDTSYNSKVIIKKTETALALPSREASAVVYHLPGMSLFYNDEGGKPPVKTPIKLILAETKNNIKKYGYSVVVFHPQDFVERDNKGNVIGNEINMSEVNDLSRLIDSLVQERVPIVHFSTVIKYIDRNQLYSSPNFNQRSLQCSSGWYLSTYYTPLESDFNGPKKTILALKQVTNLSTKNDAGSTIAIANSSSSLSTFTSFLNAVQDYGWGKTRDGNYLGYYHNQYFLASHPLNSIGKTLKIGDVAVDPSIIALGTKMTLPALPSPWDSKTYTASDIGDAIKGKHIGIFIGEGKVAQESDAVKSLNKPTSNSTHTTSTVTNDNVKLCHF